MPALANTASIPPKCSVALYVHAAAGVAFFKNDVAAIFGGKSVAFFSVDVHECHLPAFCREFAHGGFAYAGCTAGNEYRFSGILFFHLFFMFVWLYQYANICMLAGRMMLSIRLFLLFSVIFVPLRKI